AWRPAGERPAAFLSLMDRVRQQPLQASGEVVGIDKLINGTMSRLTSRSRWPSLGDALAAAERGDGNPLATLASGYRNSGASNAADARHAITCLDHPSPRDPAAYPALADAWRAQAPVFGPVFAWSVLSCGVWTSPATRPARPVRAAGAPPVLVVGTTGDPATPRTWAESLAGQLEQGVLVLRQGEEHVAYYYSACVRAIVDAYLIDGRPPADGTVCAR
ncbi:MAG TPA: alpha/beta hydrolase, partial [Acidimicrobiia bacterium]|nr:alpha/beta hydrolase [Acidimicrobiia bacterium]